MHFLIELLHAENHDFRTNGEVRLLRCLDLSVSTVFDVGAHKGEWALEASKRCPNATIYCFEISSKTRDELYQTVAHCDKIEVLNFGLLDCIGQECVKYYPDRDKVTSIYDFPFDEKSIHTQESVRTGDSVIEECGIDYIDLLKIDAEGSDFRILRGFENALNREMISVIQFEYGYACVLARKFLIDFYEYLEPKGYTIGKLHAKHVDFRPYRLMDENFFGPNFVAVHRSCQSLISRLASPD